MGFWTDKKVLVAGGQGFIGSNLCKKLNELGAEVTTTTHVGSKLLLPNNFDNCDLLNKEDCKKVVECQDYIFMCAAVTHGAAFMASNPTALVTPNLIMNAQMLEASYQAGVKKFIFISSSAAYPDTKNVPTKESDMDKGDPHDVYFGVGGMKRYTEILCQLYSEKIKNPMQTVVVRPSNVFGKGDDFNFETSHVMAALIRKVADRHQPIEVWGTGEDVRDFIYISDFIEGLLLVSEKIDNFQPINIASGKGYSVKEILQKIIEIDGYDITLKCEINFNPDKPSMIPVRLIDNTLAKIALGFEPKISIEEGIKMTLDHYRGNLSLNKGNK